jgi:hypothetical protein
VFHHCLTRMRENLSVIPFAALVAVVITPTQGQVAQAAGDEVPLDVVADSVRARGYACEDPREAKRDEAASKPDEAAWLIDCGNAHYRVVYMGDASVEVEPVD